MPDPSDTLTRRRFLNAAAASAAAATMARRPSCRAGESGTTRGRKMLLSFYCDDTGPYVAGADAFGRFLDYCAEHRLAGESSCILGMNGRSMARQPNKEEDAYLRQVARAWQCGIDTHLELMTHNRLFDFDANRPADGAAHEGLWLHEPAITVEQYERYFQNVIAEGKRVGIRFTGLTWPGCGCEVCKKRYAALRAEGHTEPNPAAWQALLNLAQAGQFRGPTVPCFFGSSETKFGIHKKAAAGKCAVYDLMPNARDCFGIWENNPQRVDPDYYITADGKAGILVRHLQAQSPYCIWYAHWQGLNPAKGVGWQAFTTVVKRIRTHLAERVVWMRPSQITERYLAAGGWSFLDSL
jgi:hypothetical protein